MKKMTLFKVLIVLVLGVVGLGFYQGWFVVSSDSRASGSNKVDVRLTVDPDKAKADAAAVKTKARDLTSGAKGASPSPEAERSSE